MKKLFKKKIEGILGLFEQNKIIIVLVILFYFGIVLGSLLFNYSQTKYDDMLSTFSSELSSDFDHGAIFINCTIINLSYFALIVLFGLSTVGQYILYIFPIIKGISYGYSSAFVYSVIDKNGLLANIIGILPQTFLSALLIVIGCKISILFSKKYRETTKDGFKNYLLIESALFLLSMVVSLLDVFVAGPTLKIFY